MKEFLNFFEFGELPRDEELVEELFQYENIRVERIISTGQSSDYYDQDEAEYVFLLKGSSKLEIGDRIVELNAGDSIFIEAHEVHRVLETSKTEETIWLCIFVK